MAVTPESLLKKLSPPMLAVLASEPPRDEENWLFELKYDGFRAISAVVGGQVAMWSRNALDLASRFPSIDRALRRIKADAVLDGEVVALDEKGIPRFQLLQRSEGARTIYIVFDLLWLNGDDVRGLPIEERRKLLEKVLRRPPERICISEVTEGDAASALERAGKKGYEGLIGKLRGSRYESRRSRNWIKLKAINMQELAIVGYTPMENSSRDIGALLLGVVEAGELRYAGKVGTGYTAKVRSQLKELLDRDVVPAAMVKGAPRMRDARWVTPRFVAQVSFTEWTSDGKLRHPSFLGLRDDKSPMEAAREVAVPATEKKSTTKKSSTKRSTARKQNAKGAGAANIEVKITNRDRVIYPRDGYTKQDVIDYFNAVAPVMLPTLRDRPLALEHWNQGIDKPSWYHQNTAKDAPDWATRVATPTRTGNKSIEHLVVDRAETLTWLGQMSALTLHMWSSRGESLENPDWIVFDLDPAKGKGIEQAIEAALVLRRFFEELEIPSVPKTSGKRGIHLFVPLAPGHSHEEAADFACNLVELVEKQVPTTTTERAIAARRGRLYLDCLQNGYGKTLVAPYSLRAIDGAPVSAPLKWSEVSKKLDPSKFNMKTMPKRIDKVGDLFAPVLKNGIKLARFRR